MYLTDWLSKKYPEESLESLSSDILCQRLIKFYQELKKSPIQHYSPSAHLSIRAALERHLSELSVFSSISIIREQKFQAANKSLNAKLKLIKVQGQGKVRHHPSISAEDIKKCYETKVLEKIKGPSQKKSFTIETDANGNEFVAMAVSESTKNH